MVECISGKTLLIISGGTEAVPGIKHAKKMGLYVVVSDGDENAPGFNYADDKIIASTYNVDDTIQKVKYYHNNIRKINGVICIASDVPLTVASVSKTLNLPSIPIESAMLSINKLSMKDKFRVSNIPIPDYKQVNDLNHLYEIIKDWGYPLVIKPVDSRGARGVLRLVKDIDLNWAYNHSIENSPSHTVMVEKFLSGPQISTEAIIVDGIGYPIGFSDRNYEMLEEFSPYIIENGGGFPSKLSVNDQLSVSNMAINAGLSLGVKNGICKGDMVFTKNGPMVIEVALRLSGGWFSTDQIPLGLGVDLIGSAIKLAIGEKIETNELIPKYNKGVAVRYFFPKPGIVKEIINEKKYMNVKWVHKIGFFVKPGDLIKDVTNHTKRAGFVITVGRTQALAVERALEVIDTVNIKTEPIFS